MILFLQPVKNMQKYFELPSYNLRFDIELKVAPEDYSEEDGIKMNLMRV